MKAKIMILSVVILSLAVPAGSIYWFNSYVNSLESSRYYEEGTIVKKAVGQEDIQFTLMKSLLINETPEEIDSFIEQEASKGNIIIVDANAEFFADISVGEKVRVYFDGDVLKESNPPQGEAEKIERF
ncbi:DUF3221 domain-containing protein [Bacillus sp. 2205SS5-2]|uniref:DUF3221 domain-containing protein n=1 Tax=Bacillus sp. 2205SS5-2 TaxID=3109031 RepID=UPI0030049EF3